MSCHDFNSNMVRLRLPAAAGRGKDIRDFNSNMVRLRPIRIPACIMQRAFQFQYGAIKTIQPQPVAELSHRFQFQYGAIKTATEQLVHIVRTHFNSNMVRLRPALHDVVAVVLKFQFQYGAIKTGLECADMGNLLAFQFQYGAIKTDCPQLVCYTFSISIPIWCD